MRRNLKKRSCAILCTCLLMVNVLGSMSYAENMEQYATDTDAAYAYAADTDVTETESVATAGDATDIYASSATAGDAADMNTPSATAGDAADINTSSVIGADVLLYAASPDVPEGGYSIEINSQADWDSLFTHTAGDGSGWTSSGGTTAIYTENKNPVVIILNADIILSANTTLTIPPIDAVSKDFLLYGNGHSIDINGSVFNLQAANTVAIENTHIKNGTVRVQGHFSFSCSDSQFSVATVELYTSGTTERAYITGCKFFDCPEPCIWSKGAPCPVSFSDCNMDCCGLLFTSENLCRVSFSSIMAENCTGTVLGYTSPSGDSYIIESISGCELSTSQTGITAIDHKSAAIEEITGCTITGFDTGIKLQRCNVSSVSDIDTITISDTTITDCITGVDIDYLSGYKNALISNLTIEAREGASGTVGYKGNGSLTSNTFLSVNYDFNQMPQIKSCHISGFDTGINLNLCSAVVSDCEISDCISGITVTSAPVAIVDTALKATTSAAYSTGITANNICYLIDCDINDFNVGSDLHASSDTTIIGCKYQNRDTNLIGAYQTSVYDTSFIGGETSVLMRGGTSYFYDCVVKGDPIATKFGVSMESSANTLHIYSLNRPYYSPSNGVYGNLKKYSDRTVNNGESEIYNCETGIDSTRVVHIADTHVHDCGTGIKSLGNTYSYGNNLIEDCTDGMEVQGLYKDVTNIDTKFTETYTDTIRNCSNDGLSGFYITSSPTEWENRLEIYNCGNYGIKNTGNLTSATVDVHDCKTGIYMTEASSNTVLGPESKVYDNLEWNVYDNATSTYAQFILNSPAGEGTLTGGAAGNVYSKNRAIIDTRDLYSDDSVYYMGTTDGMYIFSVNNLHGTAVFDTVDSGYTIGRRIAQLTTDVTSQMFAKKEGFVISTEEEGRFTYAIFAAGCNVTYDITTNGGDTFSGGNLTRISYLDGSDIDLTYTGSKPGYEFVGWNTDQNATEGLDSLSAEREDITLYAIYKKTAYINYHTYDAASDYKSDVTFYNNQDEIESGLATYNTGGDNTFAGYVLNEDAAVSSADDLMKAGDKVTVSLDGLDVYCVYGKQGRLDYLKKDGTILSTEKITVYQISSDNKKFVYTIKAGEPVEGFTFTGWKDKNDNNFIAGNTISTEDNFIVLTPVYVVKEEPTTEDTTTEDTTTEGSTTETPTTEDSTTETPTTEDSTTETPTTEDSTTETPTTEGSTTGETSTEGSTTETPTTQAPPDSPKTGDSTAPIAVIGLGILSLLGILGLSLKNKRKN